MDKKFTYLIVIVVVLIIGISGYHFLANKKLSVAVIPVPPVVQDQTANWKTATNTNLGFGLKYPDGFFAVNQQPKILVGSCSYVNTTDSCPNINDIVIKDQAAGGGDINAIKSNLADPNYWKNPKGEKSTINNVSYCLYQTGDAAMMHEYNYYYYATYLNNNQCLVVNLNTSTTNCDAYLPLETGNTEQQKNYDACITTNKNQPSILSQIVSTFKFTK